MINKVIIMNNEWVFCNQVYFSSPGNYSFQECLDRMGTICFRIRKAVCADEAQSVSDVVFVRDTRFLTLRKQVWFLWKHWMRMNVFGGKGGEGSTLMPDYKTEHINITVNMNDDRRTSLKMFRGGDVTPKIHYKCCSTEKKQQTRGRENHDVHVWVNYSFQPLLVLLSDLVCSSQCAGLYVSYLSVWCRWSVSGSPESSESLEDLKLELPEARLHPDSWLSRFTTAQYGALRYKIYSPLSWCRL